MPNFRRARLIRTTRLVPPIALAALLSACGGQPTPAQNAAAVPDEATNAAAPAAEAGNAAAPAADNTAAPAAEATPAPAESPAAAAPAQTAAATGPAGDAANGAKVFIQCKVCHAVEPGKNGLGPTLHGVVGRKAAQLAGFNFSPAMKASNLVWDDATLHDYLRAPMKKVPGTKMAFAGIADEQKRADVVAYLDTLK